MDRQVQAKLTQFRVKEEILLKTQKKD